MKAVMMHHTHPNERRSILRLSLSACLAMSSLGCLAAAAPTRADTVKLEPLADNWISSCSTGCTVNNGGMGELRVRASWWGSPGNFEPKNFRSLLTFDLGSLPADENLITHATMGLYYFEAAGPPHSDPVGRTYDVRRLTNVWDEMNSTWQARDDYNEPNPVYWDSYDSGEPEYQPGGGDFASTVYASAVVPASAGQWVTWDVTALVKEGLGGTDNFGFLIKDAAEYESDPGGGEISYIAKFRSGEFADNAFRPYLEVTFEDNPIPTVSEWGLIVTAMLMVTAGTLILQSRTRMSRASG